MPPSIPLAPPDAARAGGAPTRVWWLVFAVLAIAGHAFFLREPAALKWFGFAAYPQFVDAIALLSAGEAAQLGWDVYRANPLDPFGRPHSYPSVWLVLGKLGLTRADNAWFGPLTVGVGLLALLGSVRPRTAAQFVEALAFVGGPGVLLAVYRANNDLWVFALLALLVPALLHPKRAVRLVAPVVVAFAAMLKYYPLFAGAMLLAGRDARERRFLFILFAALALLVGFSVIEDLRHFSATQPMVVRFGSFGACLALREWGFPYATLLSVLVGGVVVVVAGLRLGRHSVERDDVMWHDAAFLGFVLGGVLLTGCFWAGANWGYRWIFAAWLLPWFWNRPVELHRRTHGLAWSIVRCGWWIPVWIAPMYVWLVRATGIPRAAEPGVWWLTQGIEWIWFSCLTVVVVRAVWPRLRDGCVTGVT